MAAVTLDILALDRRSDVPLQTQLYRALREAILHGRLRPGRTTGAGIGSIQKCQLDLFVDPMAA